MDRLRRSYCHFAAASFAQQRFLIKAIPFAHDVYKRFHFAYIGYSPSEAVALQTWNNFAAIISNSAAGFISDRVGRKRNLLGAWVLCAAVIVICSIFVAPNQFLFCIGLMLLFGFSLNYAITSVNLLMPEQYPTAIRSTGVAWCQAFARFGLRFGVVRF